MINTNDIYIEQMVKKRDTMSDVIKKCFMLFIGLIVVAGCVLLLFYAGEYNYAPFAMLLIGLVIYFVWHLISAQNLEFEYIYTNGEIDFDKISARRNRKRVITLRVTSMQAFYEFNREEYKQKHFDKVYNMATNLEDEGIYCAEFNDPDVGHCVMLFSPNEKILKEVQTIFNRNKAFKNV